MNKEEMAKKVCPFLMQVVPVRKPVQISGQIETELQIMKATCIGEECAAFIYEPACADSETGRKHPARYRCGVVR